MHPACKTTTAAAQIRYQTAEEALANPVIMGINIYSIDDKSM